MRSWGRVQWRLADEWDGGFGWIVDEPLSRASHALLLGGGVWLIDPVDVPEAEEHVRALGEPAGVLQLLDRHNRDCAEVAARLGVPHVKLSGAGPFEAVRVVDLPRWKEIVLWWPARRVLIAADALGTFAYWVARGERLGVHPLLRLFPPRQLERLEPEHILAGHGTGVHEGATPALQEALRTSRRRFLRLLL